MSVLKVTFHWTAMARLRWWVAASFPSIHWSESIAPNQTTFRYSNKWVFKQKFIGLFVNSVCGDSSKLVTSFGTGSFGPG